MSRYGIAQTSNAVMDVNVVHSDWNQFCSEHRGSGRKAADTPENIIILSCGLSNG